MMAIKFPDKMHKKIRPKLCVKLVRLLAPFPWGIHETTNPRILVVWNIFSHILGIIIPIDFHIFQRGSNHQPARILIVWVIHPGFKLRFSLPQRNSQTDWKFHEIPNQSQAGQPKMMCVLRRLSFFFANFPQHLQMVHECP